MRALKLVSIIGAGQMGSGIAQVVAAAGFKVHIFDMSSTQLDKSLATIKENITYQVKKKLISNAVAVSTLQNIRLQNISLNGSLKSAVATADLIIEAILEQETAKKELFTQLADLTQPNAILASNTSAISITRLAESWVRPENFIGLHFMNPVPRMELVEVIAGQKTAPKTLQCALTFVEKIGKTAAVAQDYPGFICNRILIPMLNEAIFAVQDGTGDVTAIDSVMKLGAHHPMGPLALADFIGLDTCLAIMKVLYHGFADPKYRPCPLLVKMVDAGLLGKKTGYGFYDYSTTPPVATLPLRAHSSVG